MIYYTIYLKQLTNDTGYIDVCLQDDQLFKDYLSFLDIGMKAHRTYLLASPAAAPGQAGSFAIDIAAIAAIVTAPPAAQRGARPAVPAGKFAP